MKIPIGNFGFRAQDPVQHGSQGYSPGATEALGNLGKTGVAVSAQLLAQHTKLKKEKETKEEEEKRALDSLADQNTHLDKLEFYRRNIKDTGGRFKSGELPVSDAKAVFEAIIDNAPQTDTSGWEPERIERFNLADRELLLNARQAFEVHVTQARAADRGKQVEKRFSQITGLVANGMPADIANEQLFNDTDFQDSLNMSYGSNADGRMEDVAASNWFNEANYQLNQHSDDPAKLQALKKAITDKKGRYFGNLDPDRKNNLLHNISVHQDRLQYQAQMEAAVEEAKARGVVENARLNASLGAPFSTEARATGLKLVEGTTHEAEYRDLMNEADEMRQIRVQPTHIQNAHARKLRDELLGKVDRTAQDSAKVNRQINAIKNMQLKRNENILAFIEEDLGSASFEALDFTLAITKEGRDALIEQLSYRANTIWSMQVAYGNGVQRNLLKPDELAQLSGFFAKTTPAEQVDMLQVLSEIAPSNKDYRAILKQLGQTSPELAEAGILANKYYISENNWLSPDKIRRSKEIALRMVEGYSGIRNKNITSDDIPPNEWFNEQLTPFKEAFRGNPEARRNALKVMKSYYAGEAAATGSLGKEKNLLGAWVWPSDILNDRVTAAILGEMVDFHESKVFTPQGMGSYLFMDEMEKKVKNAPYGKYLIDNPLFDSSHVSLMQASGSAYFAMLGESYARDDKGKRIIIKIDE